MGIRQAFVQRGVVGSVVLSFRWESIIPAGLFLRSTYIWLTATTRDQEGWHRCLCIRGWSSGDSLISCTIYTRYSTAVCGYLKYKFIWLLILVNIYFLLFSKLLKSIHSQRSWMLDYDNWVRMPESEDRAHEPAGRAGVQNSCRGPARDGPLLALSLILQSESREPKHNETSSLQWTPLSSQGLRCTQAVLLH